MRTIDVDPEIIGLLRELRLEQSREAISPFVFTQSNSPEPMHPQSPARYMQKLSAKCGVPDLHPHKLRHTFASIAITNGPTWQACPKSSATVTRPLRSVCTLTQIRKAFVVPVKFSEMR